jgi:hypothetical protein
MKNSLTTVRPGAAGAWLKQCLEEVLNGETRLIFAI